MSEAKQNMENEGGVIYTLEKNVTPNSPKDNSDSGIHIKGQGSENETVQKWTEKKYKSTHIADALMEVAFMQEDFDWYDRYKYTKEKCLDKIITGEGRAYGKYCKRDWCPICLAIRKASHINKYYPVIKSWERPTFLTLTAKSHKHQELSMWVDYLINNLNLILGKLKMRNYRGTSERYECLICTECCYNPLEQTYNPHFHIITANYTQARILREEWLIAFSRSHVHPVAQYIDVVKDKQKNLMEVIKYGAKILTDAEMKKGHERTRLPYIYAAALHEINKAFFRKHLIRYRGRKIPKVEKEKSEKIIKEIEGWSYDKIMRTWINETTGIPFTNKYIPDQNLENIYEKNVDYESR